MKTSCPRLTLAIPLFTWAVSAAFASLAEENRQAGTPDWRLSSVELDHADGRGLRSRAVEGYASRASVYPGESIAFHLSASPAAKVVVDIYRSGYYGGAGGRQVWESEPLAAKAQSTPEGGEERVRECVWPETASLTIPDDWRSGVYLAKLTRQDTQAQSYIIFVVKSRQPADLLFQVSDLTWQSYNKWPGKDSLYDDGGERDRFNQYLYTGRETTVSYDRPYAMYAQLQRVSEYVGSGSYLLTEYPLAYWLEKEGYEVAYCSNLDTDRDPAVLDRAKVMLSVGHDEYWTRRAYENVKAAQAKGLSIAFLSGNALLHAVEMMPSSATGQPGRRFSRADSLRREGRQLMGATTYGAGLGDWTIRQADHWIFQGTGAKNGDSIRNLVGWEYHGPPYAEIEGLEIIASSELHSYWSDHYMEFGAVVYPGPRGSWVFNAATIWWSQALSEPPGHVRGASGESRTLGVDERVQRITHNFLRRCLEDSEIQLTAFP